MWSGEFANVIEKAKVATFARCVVQHEARLTFCVRVF